MFRSAQRVLLLVLALCAWPLSAQNSASLTNYFVGKEVVVKLDMPGSQQGIDLRFNNDNPMNWKEYSNRLKANGVAIHKGDTARVTGFVVKNDRIEFQLDGGGFGTFGDDTSTTVTPQVVDKSDYEKQLERDIANTTDEDRKRQLQRDLDRERARRERQNQDNRAAADVASQIKAQKVADKRLQGGSRFNLRWSGSIPPDQLNPDAVMKLLADYVTFAGAQQAAPPATLQASTGDAAIPATAQLKRGMKMAEVTNLFGPGKQLSESVSGDGLKTQVFEYTTGARIVNVTYVEGLVVRYSIASN
ncbi:MAG TPA: hypothetical protein VMB49_01600 [Acidobacteriaceae bacterium]|nr:hypothetical protein [Acidobacteriaceae bacterium]